MVPNGGHYSKAMGAEQLSKNINSKDLAQKKPGFPTHTLKTINRSLDTS